MLLLVLSLAIVPSLTRNRARRIDAEVERVDIAPCQLHPRFAVTMSRIATCNAKVAITDTILHEIDHSRGYQPTINPETAHCIVKTSTLVNMQRGLVAFILVCLFVATHAFNAAFRASSRPRTGLRSDLTMKGKGGKVPVNQRGEYMKQQRMMDQKAQMEMGKKEGVPVFKVFVRPVAGGLWIPCGDLAGDDRATALVNAYMSGFMTDMYKNQIRQGIAKSVFSQEDAFVNGLIQNYKPFKKFTKKDLQFGFKVDYEGLEEKMGEQKIEALEPGMEKNWGDNIREGLSGMFNNN